MVLDPFSALGVASNIVQFVDYGSRLAYQIYALYHSDSGSVNGHADILELASQFKRLAERLSEVAPAKDNQADLTTDQEAFDSLLRSCKNRANELIALVEDLKVDKNNKLWSSIRQSVRARRKQEAIRELVAKIKRLQEMMNTYLLVLLTGEHHSEVFQALQLVTHNNARMQIEWEQDIENIKNEMIDEIRKSRHASSEPPSSVNMVVLSNGLSTLASESRTLSCVHVILKSLDFYELRSRMSNVKEAHPDTFEWIFDQNTSGHGCTLADWLKDGSGIYWTAGKAGSGKSTLFKFLQKHSQTYSLLRQWAEPRKLVVTSFFMWNSGTHLQKSQEGLLRSLLYQVLRLCPQLIPYVCPTRWQETLSGPGQTSTDFWDRDDLLDAFKRLLQQSIDTHRFCFFIDGLDEYDGDHFELVDLLKYLFECESIKICISSRPLNLFRESFGRQTATHMDLERFTRRDIIMYVRDTVEKNTLFWELKKQDPQYSDLVKEIVDRAQGVFLWVVLVVRSLLRGLTNADRICDLQKRLREFPLELEPYFRHMFNGIEPIYRPQMAKYFQVALQARQPYGLITFSLLDDDTENAIRTYLLSAEWGASAASDRLRNTQKRVNACCHGLLETYKSMTVDFFHRTVRDFLSLDDMQVTLAMHSEPGLDIDMTLCRAFLAELKCIPHVDHPISLHAVSGSKSGLKISNFNELRDVPEDILLNFWFHARQIERKSGQTPLSLLDEFRESLPESYHDYSDLKGNLVLRAEQSDGTDRFLLEAIRSGLVLYPSRKFIDSPGLLSLSSGTLLLSRALYAAPPTTQGPYSSLALVDELIKCGVNSDSTLPETWAPCNPLSDPEVKSTVSVAKPYDLQNVQLHTPWQIFLFHIFHGKDSASSSALGYWFQVAKLLLEHQPNRLTTLNVSREMSLTVSEIFRAVFPPEQAEALCQQLVIAERAASNAVSLPEDESCQEETNTIPTGTSSSAIGINWLMSWFR